MKGATGWHDPATARAYREFERRHTRYRRASERLAREAALAPGLRVLDLAAGTGGTAAAVLPLLGEPLRLDCVEPSAPMRGAGRQRLGDRPGLRWLASLEEAEAAYDRIVCGAALWQWPALGEILRTLAARLAPGGALVFNIPAAYLGEPDGPGGGADPWLTDLAARLGPLPDAAGHAARHPARHASVPETRTTALVERWIAEAGLLARPWTHLQRLRQAAWCDWHKIPVVTDTRWPGVTAAERARRIDAVAQGLDMASWRPERWRGWTAWKPKFPVRSLDGIEPRHGDCACWLPAARADGAVLMRGLLPPQSLQHLARSVMDAARADGMIDGRGGWTGGRARALHELQHGLALQQRVALLPEFQALVNEPRLLQVATQLLGTPALGGRGSVVRIAPPEHWVPATPPHQDASYVDPARATWSAWVPLTPCGMAEGVLAVALGAHDEPGDAGPWRAARMAPGDVLWVHAQTWHRACPNLRPSRPRLSVDLRFGPP